MPPNAASIDAAVAYGSLGETRIWYDVTGCETVVMSAAAQNPFRLTLASSPPKVEGLTSSKGWAPVASASYSIWNSWLLIALTTACLSLRPTIASIAF